MLRLKEGFKGERALILPPYIIDRIKNDHLLASLYITDIGYYPKAAYHYRRRTTPIDEYVLLYCVDGNGIVKIGQEGDSFNLHSNQYVILPANIIHEYGSAEGSAWTIYWIHFTGSLAPYYAQDARTPQSVVTDSHSRISNRINLFEEIYNILSNGLTDDNMHYASSLLHHYLGTLRYLQSYRNAEPGTEADNIVEAIKHYMEENIESHITLKQISEYIGVSTSHMSLKFRQHTGISPIQYLNNMRIEKAAQMLVQTNMQINQISYKLGFEDPLYFSRMFNKLKGISPRDYRMTNT